ncbi:50S ribosomal protein L33, putative [Plasmodium malariae]|uniref:50S ribosomal protein L33, putative n=1 Tax=Plasmodium malariae TaxID=5858 RepID=A0A1C3KAL2_PLAMA|nr:50S ribosomal protein L33, putative [Plasmodium malariae]
MLFLSNVFFRSRSKRVHVSLVSSCASNYIYSTYISPNKSKFRLALRKHDPVINRHVMFYQKHIKSKTKKKLTLHGINYARFTGICCLMLFESATLTNAVITPMILYMDAFIFSHSVLIPMTK